MTNEEYWQRIERIPMNFERPSTDGLSRIYRSQQGIPVSVTNPDTYSEEERVAMVENYETMYSPRRT